MIWLNASNKISEKELIANIKNGDEAAYKALFSSYYKLLLGTAFNIMKNIDLSKDCVQEVFISIWKNRATLEIKTSLTPYLKRAVINRCINQLKRSERFDNEKKLEDLNLANTNSAIQNIAKDELQKVIDKGLNQLPERCRVIFVMRRFEGYKVKEIGEILEISPKTVENQLTKALKVLKAIVELFQKENT